MTSSSAKQVDNTDRELVDAMLVMWKSDYCFRARVLLFHDEFQGVLLPRMCQLEKSGDKF